MGVELTTEEAAQLIDIGERILQIISRAQGREESYLARRDEFKILQFPLEKTEANDGGMLGTQAIENSLIEGVKKLLVKLNLKGSLRVRSNGLLEFRSSFLGSVYGRSEEEIEEKIQNKLKLLRTRKAQKLREKPPKLSEFFEKNYLPYKKNQQRAENTLNGIMYNFNFIVRAGFNKRINLYTPSMIEDFLFSIPTTRKRQIVQGLLNNIFKRAVALSVIKTNPCAPLDPVKHMGKEGKALSFGEQEIFFEKLFCSDLPLDRKLYLIFVYLTGTRRNEAISLRVSDVNLHDKILHIPGTKTAGSDRDMPLFPLVEKLLAAIEPQGGRFFPFRREYADAAFKAVSVGHKLHDLRHTFGTICICCDKLDIKTVSLWMGHSTIQTTLKIYTHPENLDKSLFFRGDVTNEEKIKILRQKKEKIMKKIEEFLDDRTHNCTQKTP